MKPISLFRLAGALVPLVACLLHVPALASCGSAFCSINTDWTSQALGVAEGSSLDLRYEYIRQDQPRAGSRRVGVGEIPHHHDEVRTTNRNLLLNYSRNFASGWGYSVVLPMVDRDHLHVHNHRGTQLPQEWSFQELGDVRLIGRYQRAVGDQERGARAAGAVFGMKLPTARTSVKNGAGEVAERSLQPGTGTTDAIVGMFFHQQLTARASSWFAQAQYQHPLNQRDGFAPGGQLTADLGIATRLADRLSGLVQLNAVVKQRDHGAQAEPADSGSRALFLSPGVSYDWSDRVRVYAFYQQPLQQSMNGVQLTARRALMVGVTTQF
jgi:hypothetical protein